MISDLQLHRSAPLLPLLLLGVLAAGAPAQAQAPEMARQVEVIRTAYGIPHIRAENLRAAGYAMGYVQMEDHGVRVAHGLVRARGRLAEHFGRDSLAADFENRRTHARATETWPLLEQDTRDFMEGFAAGVNRYVELHPAEFGEHIRPDLTGEDVHAFGLRVARPPSARRFLERMNAQEITDAEPEPSVDPEDGSNAWAFAPSRTRSGRAILMRNPHLSWSAGYYEAQVVVPGKLDFYGDFRVGGPLGIVGGFNRRLGWATTNNAPDLDEIYALALDPARPDHYLFDGASVPVREERVTIEYRDGDGLASETRSFLATALGPVIHRDSASLYVQRFAGDGEYRMDEQFLRMMKATSLAEWKEAVNLRARTSSNLTYADADGNILYVWNATIPRLPHAPGGDTLAIHASTSAEVWQRPVVFDSLPQLLNPRGGYVRNENDPPHLTNLNEPLHPLLFPSNFPAASLRLRSQHSLELIHGNGKVSLEEVVAMKHSMRMTLADRVKDDLVAAVRAGSPAPEVARAIALLHRWDNTVAAESRGGVLFQTWWERYLRTAPRASGTPASVGFPAPPEALFAEPWSAARPVATPRGLADRERAAAAFAWAVEETARRHGSWDVAWGDVHRVRRGEVDVPVGGCTGMLGCFRVLSFSEAEDGKREVVGGDGWVFAVEFTDVPRAYSVLAYGQSSREDSPHFADQVAMFANNEMKRVLFTRQDVDRAAVRRYRPGVE
jgi:acyl-homoserine-lactone acylase